MPDISLESWPVKSRSPDPWNARKTRYPSWPKSQKVGRYPKLKMSDDYDRVTDITTNRRKLTHKISILSKGVMYRTSPLLMEEH